MGMDFWGLVRKRVWKITFFGLKLSQDSENRAAHPHQEFPGVPCWQLLTFWQSVRFIFRLKESWSHLTDNIGYWTDWSM